MATKNVMKDDSLITVLANSNRAKLPDTALGPMLTSEGNSGIIKAGNETLVPEAAANEEITPEEAEPQVLLVHRVECHRVVTHEHSHQHKIFLDEPRLFKNVRLDGPLRGIRPVPDNNILISLPKGPLQRLQLLRVLGELG